MPVNVVTVVEKEVSRWDEFTGRTGAGRVSRHSAARVRYITEIHFEAGAIVKKGDLLYVIDPRPYQADFDRAAAEVERMQAQLKLSQIELDRSKELRAKNTISASEFDQKAATYQGSAAAQSAEAAKNSAALNLEFTQIKSPIDGRVSDAHHRRQPRPARRRPGKRADHSRLGRSDLCEGGRRRKRDPKIRKAPTEGKRVSARTAKIPALIELGNETDFPHEGYIDFVDDRLDPRIRTIRARVTSKSGTLLFTHQVSLCIRCALPAPPRTRAALAFGSGDQFIKVRNTRSL